MGEVEYKLTKTWQRTVKALGNEQGRLIRELQETQEALQDLARLIGDEFSLSPDQGALRFEQKDGGAIVLVYTPTGAAQEGSLDGEVTFED